MEELQERLEIILQISNKLFVSHSSKSENKIGYFKTELNKTNFTIIF